MRYISLYFAAGLLSCDVNQADPACPNGPGQLVAHIPPLMPAKPIETDIEIRGTLDRPPGITIYDLEIAGIAATGMGLDFDSFKATIPHARLVMLSESAVSQGIATIEVTARTNCGSARVSLGSLPVPVNQKPGVKVSRMGFEPALIPSDAGYLPADGSAQATLRLRANPEAAGAQVTLTTSSGSFDGVGAGNTITLTGDGKADAVAACAFKSDRDAQISASAQGISATTAITVVGAPTLVPSSATLGPGQSTTVTVLTRGQVRWCQASPASGISVTSGGTDLMASPGGKDTSGDRMLDIEVTVANPLPAAAMTTLSCVDVFGQFSTATYKAKP